MALNALRTIILRFFHFFKLFPFLMEHLYEVLNNNKGSTNTFDKHSIRMDDMNMTVVESGTAALSELNSLQTY